MSEQKAITVVSKRPPMVPRVLAGGILGADIGLYVYAVAAAQYATSAGPLLIATLISASGMAAMAALAAYFVQWRRGSIRRLNRDLIAISSMAERRLIDEDEYHQLKTRLIDTYQPQRTDAGRIVRPALWGALAGSFVPLLLAGAFVWAPIPFFLMALLIPGGLGAITVAGVTEAVYWLGRLNASQLPSGEPADWVPLGSGASRLLKK
jgi:hypothetical protein